MSIEREVKYLHDRYVDVCCMCTHGSCDECDIQTFIEQLDKILDDVDPKLLY